MFVIECILIFVFDRDYVAIIDGQDFFLCILAKRALIFLSVAPLLTVDVSLSEAVVDLASTV